MSLAASIISSTLNAGTPLLLAAPGEGLPYLLFSLLLVAALGAAIRHRLPGGHSAH